MTFLTRLVHSAIDALFSLTGSYGWAILLLTLAIRLLLLPLSLYGQRANQRATALQQAVKTGEQEPELLARSSKAMLAGCLPMLAQWPLVVAVYQGLSTFPYAVTASFFWLQNLAVPDPYFILPALLVGTQLWQSLATLPRAQRASALVLPLLMGLFFLKASAGVALYWIASNLISLAQHYLINRRALTA